MKRTAALTWSLRAPSMGLPQLKRLPTGSEWLDGVIRAGMQGYGGPPHGDSSRWDWGLTLRTLDVAMQRHKMLCEFVEGMTPEQKDALWSDPSEEAARVRRLA